MNRKEQKAAIRHLQDLLMVEDIVEKYRSAATPIFQSDIVAFKMAIKALEKQTPQKVAWEESTFWGVIKKQPVCPVCDYYLTATYFIDKDELDNFSVVGVGKEKVTYCDHCGQAIDWSGYDETI